MNMVTGRSNTFGSSFKKIRCKSHEIEFSCHSL